MKRKSLFVLSVLVTLILTAFVVSTASASTGCFTDTNGHWAETFICWLKDNGITSGTAPGIYSPEANVTRAQMAVFLQKVDELAVSQAKAYTDTSLSTGLTLFNAGPSGWNPYDIAGFPSRYVAHYRSVANLRSSAVAPGVNYYVLSPDLPAAMYGSHLNYLWGVKVCYQATATAQLTLLDLVHWVDNTATAAYDPGIPAGHEVFDATVRTDSFCRSLLLTTPTPIAGGDTISVYVAVNLTATADFVSIGAISFLLLPSANAGILMPTDVPYVPPPSHDLPLLPSGDDTIR